MEQRMLYLAVYDTAIPGMGRTVRGQEMIRFFSNKYELHVVDFQEDIKSPSLVSQRAYKNVNERTKVPFSRMGHFVFSPSLLSKAIGNVRSQNFDIIFADYGTAGTYGYLISRTFGIPWVYLSHQVEYRRFLNFARKDYRRFPFVPLLYLIERLACKANLIVAISEPDAAVFSKWVSADKLTVIPQGFDETTFHPYYKAQQTNQPIVLFVGNYDYGPNREAVDIILDHVLPRVLEIFPDTLFQFVGPNPPKNISHPNIQFTGLVEDLVTYFRRATVTIVPIISAGGMRTKIVEGLACGKRVISTDIAAAGIPKYYKNLIISDIANFPSAICKEIESPRLVNDEDHHSLVEAFSWRKMLERLYNKCADILNS